jgi:preprotein translocase subunit YajC
MQARCEVMTPFYLLAADAPAASPFVQFVPILLVFAIFYFLLIAPMRKKQKAVQQMVENLKRGDKVVTNGGIYGEVAAVEGPIVHLKVADSVKLRVAKSAIAGLEGPGEEGGSK